jgi:hypothetical protein
LTNWLKKLKRGNELLLNCCASRPILAIEQNCDCNVKALKTLVTMAAVFQQLGDFIASYDPHRLFKQATFFSRSRLSLPKQHC